MTLFAVGQALGFSLGEIQDYLDTETIAKTWA